MPDDDIVDESVTPPPRTFERTVMLDDISIRAGGDGRTVVAYAAMFEPVSAEIQDQDGHYEETIGRTAFDRTISDRAGQIQVLFNHGKTYYGTPSERYSMPIGTPEEIRPDGRGLLTVTRYSKIDLADEVLEGISNGAVRGQSFSGRFMPNRSKRTRGQAGGLDRIHRSEVALREYGPVISPAYKDAVILGVRHVQELAETILALGQSERSEVLVDTISRLNDAEFQLLNTLLGASRTIGTPPPADGTASGVSSTNDTPAAGHLSGPTKDQRERLARARALVDLKGTQ